MSLNDEVAQLLPQFIKDLNRLQPEYSYADRIWRLPLRMGKSPKNWAMAFVTHYQETYYFALTKHRLSLQMVAEGKISAAEDDYMGAREQTELAWMLERFHHQVDRIEKDWVGVYRETLRDCPLALRHGIVPTSIVWKYYPDTYRVDTELGKARVSELIALVRTYKFRQDFGGHHKEMSLELFMRYCKAAYLANADQFKGAIEPDVSGLDMYKRFADGRHEGLVDLPLKSAEAFADWYHAKPGGGHPWEIYRGGNTTHISLYVQEKHEGWSVWLAGSSTARMAETIRIALALHEAGLPVELSDAEDLVLRLLGMDNTGIIPHYRMNHRALQDFDKADKVFDCAHLYDLPRYNRILPFVTWKALAPLRALAA